MNKFLATIEIPKYSRSKYEIKNGKLTLDRVLYGSNVYPHNYGYISGTLDLDGDPMDVIVISNEVLFPTTVAPVRIIGALNMIDSGDRDTKLIGVISVDPRFAEVNSINDVSKATLAEIRDFFENYKLLENKKVEIQDFIDADKALLRIAEGEKLFKEKNP